MDRISYYKEAEKRHLKYDGKFWLKEMRHIYPIIKSLKINSILDFGCSSGYFLETLPYIEKYGYDSDEYAVELARKKRLKVSSHWEEIPLIDCILAIDIVEHFKSEELIEWIKRWYEKINKDGYLFIQTDNPYCLMSLMEFYNDWTHQRMYGAGTLTNLLELRGFKQINSGKVYKLKTGKIWGLFRFLRFPYMEEAQKYWILLQK